LNLKLRLFLQHTYLIASSLINNIFLTMIKNKTLSQLKKSWKFRAYLLLKLPLAWIMGLRIKEIDESKCITILPFKRFNYNPFKSMYFATQIAAAELSTGLLMLVAIDQRKEVSMLVKKVEASFSKKAVTDIEFVCEQGFLISDAVKNAIESGDSVSIVAYSKGLDKSGDEVCAAFITWSIKRSK
jgi:hypothetical protein